MPICLLGKKTCFRFSSSSQKHRLRMAFFSLTVFCGPHLLPAHEQYFTLFMGGGRRIERGGECRHGFAWVGVFCGVYIVSPRGQCVLCILSKLQQLRITDITVMLLGFLNHLPNYPSSFDLPNLLTHSLIIIFIRNDWQ